MFFENEMISFNILDVIRLNQKNVNTFNRERNFSALSFRFRADTVLTTNSQKFRLKDNSVCFVPSRLDYYRKSNEDDLIVIHFDATNHNDRDIECFMPRSPENLSKLFKRILNCWDKKEAGYKYRCSAILYEILAECYAQNFIPKVSNSPIQKSVDYLLANYKKTDVTIKEIAEKSFISEVYFRKLFKEEYGMSPQKYIINLRIQNAVGLISTGYYSLQEAAYLSGYADYKYFSTEFKKIKGISPSKYFYNYQK